MKDTAKSDRFDFSFSIEMLRNVQPLVNESLCGKWSNDYTICLAVLDLYCCMTTLYGTVEGKCAARLSNKQVCLFFVLVYYLNRICSSKKRLTLASENITHENDAVHGPKPTAD